MKLERWSYIKGMAGKICNSNFLKIVLSGSGYCILIRKLGNCRQRNCLNSRVATKRRWTLDAGRWTLDAGRWTLDTRNQKGVIMTIEQAIAILEAERVLQSVGCNGPDWVEGTARNNYVKQAHSVISADIRLVAEFSDLHLCKD